MAVFVDYSLAPAHQSLRTAPQLIENLLDNMTDDGDSPVLSRAPLLLQESLLFPYKDGLKFEATLIADSKDPVAAYGAVLDHPPASSYEIMNPHAYEQQAKVPLLNMPDIHPIIDAEYSPYDIGVMGELDVRILAELFGGNDRRGAADAGVGRRPLLCGAEEGCARQEHNLFRRAAVSLAVEVGGRSRGDFVKMYADELDKKYTHVTRDNSAETSQDEQIYQTNEGPVLIVTSGTDVFVSESFDLPTARKLEVLMLARAATGSRPGRFQPRSCLGPGRQHGALHGPLRHDEGGSASPFILIPCVHSAP